MDPNDLSMVERNIPNPLGLDSLLNSYKVVHRIDEDNQTISMNQYGWSLFDRVIRHSWLKNRVNLNLLKECIKYADRHCLDGAFTWSLTGEGSGYWDHVYSGRIKMIDEVLDKLRDMEKTYKEYQAGKFNPFGN